MIKNITNKYILETDKNFFLEGNEDKNIKNPNSKKKRDIEIKNGIDKEDV